jgi:hypothetical protein
MQELMTEMPTVPLQVLANIARQDQYREQHRQRMRNAAQRLEVAVPNQNANVPEWSSFAATAFGEIAEEHALEEHGDFMLEDILREGINYRDVSDVDRNSDRYKQLIDVVLIKWRDRNRVVG